MEISQSLEADFDEAVFIMAFNQTFCIDSIDTEIVELLRILGNRIVRWEDLLQAGLVDNKIYPGSAPRTKRAVLSQKGRERAKKILKQIIEKLESN